MTIYQQATRTKLSPVQRPELGNENQFKGRKPRLSATVLSAYASGVEPWLREFKLVFGGSRIMKSTPKTWQLKMLVLHPEGDTLCKKIWEMGPAIDWDDKRRVTASWGNSAGDIELKTLTIGHKR
ncbi:hypothetical protein PTT_09068 [Pyrenophora teres f. teres 0-1]|uniref:Uncharacterized protein n=1 Tax=Pyrenophora teres f. teres (strain 0-1) TaxID=861557 RepID=E3RL50_PYRTT|nr:hypothetical protein PTT_09068 [Pyrenophora teres f. teres 0-1]